MKHVLMGGLLFVALLLVGAEGWADIIEMKDGELIEGIFVGGDRGLIRFQVDDQVVVFPIGKIATITFSPLSTPDQEETPLFESDPALQAETPELVIPAGTRLSVRLQDSVDTAMNRKGDRFEATLDAPMIVNGVVVVPKGVTLQGQVVQSEQGADGSALIITLRTLSFQQQVIPITTTIYTMWDRLQRTPTTGGAEALKKARTLSISAGTRIAFKIAVPVTIEGVQE